MKKTSILTGIGIAFVALFYYFVVQAPKMDSEHVSTNSKEVSYSAEEAGTVEVILDVLEALNYYNFSTESVTNFDDVTSLITDLMNAKKHMQTGDRFVQEYTDYPNEYISVTALGMITGSSMIQESTEKLIQYLRKVNENDPSTYSDLQYQVARYLSDNKEGFSLIATSAPQVTALLWEPAQSDNPSGAIPYKVSKQERQRVLDSIDELFAEDLEEYYSSTDNFNSMIFAVDEIKKNIEPDTYEEASK